MRTKKWSKITFDSYDFNVDSDDFLNFFEDEFDKYDVSLTRIALR
jgi:hypothetical protein